VSDSKKEKSDIVHYVITSVISVVTSLITVVAIKYADIKLLDIQHQNAQHSLALENFSAATKHFLAEYGDTDTALQEVKKQGYTYFWKDFVSVKFYFVLNGHDEVVSKMNVMRAALEEAEYDTNQDKPNNLNESNENSIDEKGMNAQDRFRVQYTELVKRVEEAMTSEFGALKSEAR
jgi:hypothetical protein